MTVISPIIFMNEANILSFLENAGCGSLSAGLDGIIFKPNEVPLVSTEFIDFMNDFKIDNDVAQLWLGNTRDAKQWVQL